MQKENKKPNKNTPLGGKYKMYWIYGIIALIFFGSTLFPADWSLEKMEYNTFIKELNEGKVEEIIFYTNFSEFTKKSKILRGNFHSFLRNIFTARGLMDFFVVS